MIVVAHEGVLAKMILMHLLSPTHTQPEPDTLLPAPGPNGAPSPFAMACEAGNTVGAPTPLFNAFASRNLHVSDFLFICLQALAALLAEQQGVLASEGPQGIAKALKAARRRQQHGLTTLLEELHEKLQKA